MTSFLTLLTLLNLTQFNAFINGTTHRLVAEPMPSGAEACRICEWDGISFYCTRVLLAELSKRCMETVCADNSRVLAGVRRPSVEAECLAPAYLPRPRTKRDKRQVPISCQAQASSVESRASRAGVADAQLERLERSTLLKLKQLQKERELQNLSSELGSSAKSENTSLDEEENCLYLLPLQTNFLQRVQFASRAPVAAATSPVCLDEHLGYDLYTAQSPPSSPEAAAVNFVDDASAGSPPPIPMMAMRMDMAMIAPMRMDMAAAPPPPMIAPMRMEMAAEPMGMEMAAAPPPPPMMAPMRKGMAAEPMRMERAAAQLQLRMERAMEAEPQMQRMSMEMAARASASAGASGLSGSPAPPAARRLNQARAAAAALPEQVLASSPRRSREPAECASPTFHEHTGAMPTQELQSQQQQQQQLSSIAASDSLSLAAGRVAGAHEYEYTTYHIHRTLTLTSMIAELHSIGDCERML